MQTQVNRRPLPKAWLDDEEILRRFVPARVARELAAQGPPEQACCGAPHGQISSAAAGVPYTKEGTPYVTLGALYWPLLRFSHTRLEQEFQTAFSSRMQRWDRHVAIAVLFLTLAILLSHLAGAWPSPVPLIAQAVVLCIMPLPLVLWCVDVPANRSWVIVSVRMACHVLHAAACVMGPAAPSAGSACCLSPQAGTSAALAVSALLQPVLLQHLAPCQLLLLTLHLGCGTLQMSRNQALLQAQQLHTALLLQYAGDLLPLLVMAAVELPLRRRWLLTRCQLYAASGGPALSSCLRGGRWPLAVPPLRSRYDGPLQLD